MNYLQAVLALACLLTFSVSRSVAGTINWDGDNSVGNFSYNNNWYGDGSPSANPINFGGWVFSNDLQLNFNNGGATSLYFDYGGWQNINSVTFMGTFTTSLTLSGDGNGINFNTKIENLSSSAETVNIPLSGAKNGAGHIELNPVNGDLTISGNVFNDNNKPYEIYGENSKLLTISGDLKGDATVGLTIKQYSKVKFSSAQTFGGVVFVLSRVAHCVRYQPQRAGHFISCQRECRLASSRILQRDAGVPA